MTKPLYIVIGMWTESPALPSAGKWIHFMVTEHPGIILFLVMDVICLSGAVALTIAQASQVIVLMEYVIFRFLKLLG